MGLRCHLTFKLPLEHGLSFSQFDGGRLRFVCFASLERGVGSVKEEYLTTAVEWTQEAGSLVAGTSSSEDLRSVIISMLISAAVVVVAEDDVAGVGTLVEGM